VNRSNSPTSSGWAIILLCATALALGGCGRKAGLDLPPGAPHAAASQSTAPQAASTAAAAPATDTEAQQAATPSVFNPTYGSDAQPGAPKGRKKPFVLDPLLD
jgi:predicted small lipoprotein YifL